MSSIGTTPNRSHLMTDFETHKSGMPEAQLLASPMEFIGESPSLKRVLQQVETVAATDSAVLILGETGPHLPFVEGRGLSPPPRESPRVWFDGRQVSRIHAPGELAEVSAEALLESLQFRRETEFLCPPVRNARDSE